MNDNGTDRSGLDSDDGREVLAALARSLPKEELTWMYCRGLRSAGPVTTSELIGLLLDKRLGPTTLVTPTGWKDWRPAAGWPQFEGVIADLVRSRRLPPYTFMEWKPKALGRGASALLGLFLTLTYFTLVIAPTWVMGGYPGTLICPSGALLLAATPGGIYAVFYLRRTWRCLGALPPSIALMGCIGAVGLIVLTLLAWYVFVTTLEYVSFG